jgi:hypothetical protein
MFKIAKCRITLKGRGERERVREQCAYITCMPSKRTSTPSGDGCSGSTAGVRGACSIVGYEVYVLTMSVYEGYLHNCDARSSPCSFQVDERKGWRIDFNVYFFVYSMA